MWVALSAACGAALGTFWALYRPPAQVVEEIAFIKNLTLRPPRIQRKQTNSLEEKLVRFPVTRDWKDSHFYMLQIACGLGATAAYVLPDLILNRTEPAWLNSALVGMIAFLLPYLVLILALRRRHELFGRAVFDLLSHLVLQMAAHKNTMLAFQSAPRAVREPLGSELKNLLADLKLRPMQPALESFAQRTGHPYLKDFTQAMVYQRSLSIEVEEVFRHQEELYRRNLRERSRVRAKIYEASVAGAAIFLFGNLMGMWMVPMLVEASRSFKF